MNYKIFPGLETDTICVFLLSFAVSLSVCLFNPNIVYFTSFNYQRENISRKTE